MSKGGGNPPPSGGADNSLDFFWTIALTVAVVLIVWYFAKSHIVPIIFQLKFYQIKAITWFVEHWDTLVANHYLPSFVNIPYDSKLEDWVSYIKTSDPNSVSFDSILGISHDVGRYLRYPINLVFLIFISFLLFGHGSVRFNNIYDMNRLRSIGRNNWPQISPVSNLNLVKQDITKGPWAMSEQPLYFAKKNKIVREVSKNGKPALELIEGASYRVFSLQMGELWQGLEKLPPYILALFAVFAARSNQDASGARTLLEKISKSAEIDLDNLDFSGAKLLLVKHIRNNRPIGRVVGRHAYILTIMASMLELARTDGVVPTSDFLWLKVVDRRLWYMLNSVGRQTAFPEVAGPFAHWLIEKRLRRPLKVPMVNEAVESIRMALEEIRYVPE